MECVILLTVLIFIHKSVGKKCENPRLKNDPYNALFVNDIATGEYICPGEEDPASHTECCWQGACCPATPDFTQNEWLLKILSMSVMAICVVIIIVILISCFWRKGICYDCCLSHYYVPDVAFSSLAAAEETLHWTPRENNINRNGVIQVQMRPLEEV